MNLPLVSVCIGVYNREDYIREALDSVFAQTYPNIEVIVVDDASTDRSLEIIRKEYGSRIQLICRDRNSGMCPVTRNQAIRAGRGELIALLDSDDAWYPGKIAAQVAFMESNPAVPLCHTSVHVMDETSRVYGTRHEGRIPPTGDYFEALLEHCWITISSVMMRRSLYDETGAFNETLPYGKLGEDYEYFLRVASRHPIGFLPEPLGRYRKSRAGITHGNWRALPKSVPLYEALIDRPDVWGSRVTKERMVRRTVDAALENAGHWSHHGFPGRAAWSAWQAAKHAPANPAAWAALARDPLRALVVRARGAEATSS